MRSLNHFADINNDDVDRIESILEAFESDWTAATRPKIAAYLPLEVDLRLPALVELVHTDQEMAIRACQPLSISYYLQEFPEISDAPEIICGLIASEIRLLRLRGDNPSVDDYLAKFPELAVGVQERLKAEDDGNYLLGSDHPRSLRDGDTSRYDNLVWHARGGMGDVYRAHDTKLGREVALKRILPKFESEEGVRNRFIREVELTAKLNHPGIATVHDLICDERKNPWYVMKFVEGKNLAEVIDEHHRSSRANTTNETISLRNLLTRFVSLCNTIAYAHDRGVVHRDLKPSNLMIGPYGETVVIDWGLAAFRVKEAAAELPRDSMPSSEEREAGVTQAGQLLGTPEYMSPEQAKGLAEMNRPSSDIYSLGAILYTILTGRPPFPSERWNSLKEKIINGDFPRPREISSVIPRPLEEICLKAMSIDATNRYETAGKLAREIERWAADEKVEAHDESRFDRVRRWFRRNPAATPIGAAALILITVISSVAAWWISGSEATTRSALNDKSNALKKVQSARLAEQSALKKETAARVAEQLALKKETTALLETRRELARSSMSRGLALIEGGQAGALHWMSRALAELPDQDGEFAKHIRHNIAHLLISTPSLLSHFEIATPDNAILFPDAGKFLAAYDGTFSSTRAGYALLVDCKSGRPLAEPMRHKGFIGRMAISPDAKTAITCGEGAIAWDTSTGQAVREPFLLDQRVGGVSFSSHSDLVVLGCFDGTARLLNYRTGEVVGNPLQHSGPVNYDHEYLGVVLSPTLTTLVTQWSHTTKLWERASSRLLTEMSDVYPRAAYTKNGVFVIARSGGLEATLYNTKHGKPIPRPFIQSGTIYQVALSSNGLTAMTGSDDGTARLWRLIGVHHLLIGKEIRHSSPIGFVEFASNGNLAIIGSLGGTITFHDAATARMIGQPILHLDQPVISISNEQRKLLTISRGLSRLWDLTPLGDDKAPMQIDLGVMTLAFSSDSRTIAAGGPFQTMVFDYETNRPRASTAKYGNRVSVVALSLDGQKAISGGEDGAKLWDLKSGVLIKEFMKGLIVMAVAFSPDGKMVATGEQLGTVQLWDASNGSPIGPETKKKYPSSLNTSWSSPNPPLVFSPDSKSILIDCFGSIKLWDVSGRLAAEMIEEELLSGSSALAFAPDSQSFLTGHSTGIAKLWNREGDPIGEPMTHLSAVVSVAFSPDGSTIATGTEGGEVRLWSATSGRPIGIPMRHLARVNVVRFSQNSRLLATGSNDGTVVMWDARTGRPLGTLGGHARGVNAVMFTPDGSSILTGGSEGRVRLWPVPEPIAGTPEEIALSVEVRTGAELIGETGEIHVLDRVSWLQKKEQLNKMKAASAKRGPKTGTDKTTVTPK